MQACIVFRCLHGALNAHRRFALRAAEFDNRYKASLPFILLLLVDDCQKVLLLSQALGHHAMAAAAAFAFSAVVMHAVNHRCCLLLDQLGNVCVASYCYV